MTEEARKSRDKALKEGKTLAEWSREYVESQKQLRINKKAKNKAELEEHRRKIRMLNPKERKEKLKKIVKSDTAKSDTLHFGKTYVLRDTMDKWKNYKKSFHTDAEKPYLPGDNEKFSDAFGIAKKKGYDTFMWRGKHYNTKTKRK